ncbi:dehalogenase [Dehalococcoides mccartyi]|uniref:reductive dehalogenase n=1 Tax=Dehalococcoides TaxID=61434 RepID=UPI0004E06328|nr:MULTISPECIES: reductive dehalogenase [Dehalococcoides]AII58523.1 dehalogenase [Dehalococcoides mccartyi CG1]APH13135.1 dehalogenase [Dehalococcoides mccartyi]QYY58752.1 reductive dehalogenase [Dehalococcoides mccartyi]BAQ35346.1 putative tetrachloroethene reductive dehalogenase [Dehalococcoides sp. UCH007]
MSNFHSTLTRKDFLKGIGMAGAGLGAASAVTPMFHDLDELVASTPSTRNLPWFVKEREHGDPTTPIDWDMIQRRPYTWARMDPTLPVYDNLKAIGAPVARWLDWEDKKAEDEILYAKAREEFPGFEPGIDGFGDIRTTALTHASEMFAFGQFPQRMNLGGNMVDLVAAVRAAGGYLGSTDSYAGPKMVHTPEEMGGTKYQGTPEDNLRTLKAGIRYFGGEDVGALELDDNLKKLVFTVDQYGKTLEFGDVEECIETPRKVTIPNKCKYIFLWTMRQPYEWTRRQSGRFEGAATETSYERAYNTKAHFQDFARGLGYQMISAGNNSLSPAGAWAVLGGLGELSRASYVNHPLYGITVRVTWGFLTDMPLPPSRPIDFGARRFCESCGICAEACPFGAINPGEPTWRDDNTFGNAGFLGWRCDYTKCPHCPICQGTCPFNSHPGSFIHDVVKGTVSTTPVFNTFFKNMEKSFKYGRKNPATWWDEVDDYPYGVDTSY